jgi:hypothetical protein
MLYKSMDFRFPIVSLNLSVKIKICENSACTISHPRRSLPFNFKLSFVVKFMLQIRRMYWSIITIIITINAKTWAQVKKVSTSLPEQIFQLLRACVLWNITFLGALKYSGTTNRTSALKCVPFIEVYNGSKSYSLVLEIANIRVSALNIRNFSLSGNPSSYWPALACYVPLLLTQFVNLHTSVSFK